MIKIVQNDTTLDYFENDTTLDYFETDVVHLDKEHIIPNWYTDS